MPLRRSAVAVRRCSPKPKPQASEASASASTSASVQFRFSTQATQVRMARFPLRRRSRLSPFAQRSQVSSVLSIYLCFDAGVGVGVGVI